MKKTILSSLFISLLIIGCGEKKNKQDDVPLIEEAKDLNLDDTSIIDSTAVNIENIKDEIEESSEKLDDLLNDL